jgi:hypothetical protein
MPRRWNESAGSQGVLRHSAAELAWMNINLAEFNGRPAQNGS